MILMLLKIPACCGVPANAPVEDSVIPFGNVPLDKENVYGAVPPEATNGVEYPLPIVPIGNCNGLIVTVLAAIFNE